jgi:hypothetical protein
MESTNNWKGRNGALERRQFTGLNVHLDKVGDGSVPSLIRLSIVLIGTVVGVAKFPSCQSTVVDPCGSG